ncbi:MAG: hypothetical protein QNJ72_42800 [Pleurocapsa sp. MO_226.B13]|nr:hypothetical protein [Pleurocapsa sp. MO_226.B13]
MAIEIEVFRGDRPYTERSLYFYFNLFTIVFGRWDNTIDKRIIVLYSRQNLK